MHVKMVLWIMCRFKYTQMRIVCVHLLLSTLSILDCGVVFPINSAPLNYMQFIRVPDLYPPVTKQQYGVPFILILVKARVDGSTF